MAVIKYIIISPYSASECASLPETVADPNSMEPALSTVNSTQQPMVSQANPTEQPMDEDVNNTQDQGNISIIFIYPWRLVDGHDQK